MLTGQGKDSVDLLVEGRLGAWRDDPGALPVVESFLLAAKPVVRPPGDALPVICRLIREILGPDCGFRAGSHERRDRVGDVTSTNLCCGAWQVVGGVPESMPSTK